MSTTHRALKNTDEAAEYLHVGPRFIRRLRTDGRLKPQRQGRKIFYRVEDLDAWLDSQYDG